RRVEDGGEQQRPLVGAVHPLEHVEAAEGGGHAGDGLDVAVELPERALDRGALGRHHVDVGGGQPDAVAGCELGVGRGFEAVAVDEHGDVTTGGGGGVDAVRGRELGLRVGPRGERRGAPGRGAGVRGGRGQRGGGGG